MDPLERAALYHFLARLYLRPPDEDALDLAREVPALEAHLDADLAHAHAWLFDLNVYPYASVYLDPSGGLNAPWSDFVTGVYRALGLEVEPGRGLASGDHLAAELEAVAVLLEREAEAEGALALERARHGQKTLLVEQLLPWVPIFTHTLEHIVGESFYGLLAGLTRDLLLEHAGELLAGEPAPAFRFALPEEDVSPVYSAGGAARATLQHLITPARSGLVLTREDIARLGRRLELPVRFAERALMLEALIGAAADQERLGDAVNELRREARTQRAATEGWGRAHPALAPVWEDWLRKLEATDARLASLGDASA